MTYKNSLRPGLYKIEDDITGEVVYSDEVEKDWDGSMRLRKNLDGKHPDLEVKRLPNEAQPPITREPTYDTFVDTGRPNLIN